MANEEALNMDESKTFLEKRAYGKDGEEVEHELSKPVKVEFTGLTKEQIMAYGSDPLWVKTRWIICILFWLITAALVAGAVLSVIFMPRCAKVEKLAWWQEETFYHVNVAKFRDADGDGVGDLEGVVEKAAYLDQLGTKTIVVENVGNDPEKQLAIMKKKLLVRDIHVISSVTAKEIDSGLLEDLLIDSQIDGVMITNSNEVDKAEFSAKVKKLKELTSEISKKTFKEKFLGAIVKGNLSETLASSLDLVVHDQGFPSYIRHPVISGAKSANVGSWPSISNPTTKNDDKNSIVAQALLFLLKGTPIFRSGSEIEIAQDEYMKWDASFSCGFSSNVTLSKLAGLDCKKNVLYLQAHGSDRSTLTTYADLIRLRSKESFQWGAFKEPDVIDEKVFTFTREAPGFDGFLIAINVGKSKSVFNYKENLSIPDEATVAFFNDDHNRNFQVGEVIRTDNLALKPDEFLILQYSRVPKPKEDGAEKKSSPH